ncbi:MAG: hypothetical protein U5K33_11755, partial [Halofilum sp. (in: g-proteobacteria)]|nr:hypothetical protein [Halofilum sp. (in: g-proteobacteria)]
IYQWIPVVFLTAGVFLCPVLAVEVNKRSPRRLGTPLRAVPQSASCARIDYLRVQLHAKLVTARHLSVNPSRHPMAGVFYDFS